MPKQKGGKPLILTPANYTADPTLYPSSDAKVSGCGCAGTKSNIAAAKGKFVSYESQSGGGYCDNCTGPIGEITGPDSGYGTVTSNKPAPIPRPSGLGAGQSMTSIAETLAAMPGGGRKTRKHKKKHSKKHSKKSRKGGKKSRKHSKKSRKHSKKSRKSVKKHRTRKHRGGQRQPFANVPLSFGYALGGDLPGNKSALANPPPQHVYDHGQKNNF